MTMSCQPIDAHNGHHCMYDIVLIHRIASVGAIQDHYSWILLEIKSRFYYYNYCEVQCLS